MLDAHVARPCLPAHHRGQRGDRRILAGLGVELQNRSGVARKQLVHRRLGHEAAVVEDPDAITDSFDVVEDVRAHEDRARAAQAADQLQHVAPSSRVERADRLVEEEDGWPREHRLPDPEALAHSARVGADPAVRRIDQADRLQYLFHARAQGRAVEPVQPAHECQQFAPGHPAVVARVLVERADALGEGAAAGRGVDPRDSGAARRGPGEARQEAEGGGLPRAVRPEKAEDAAGRDVEIEVIERDVEPVALREPAGADLAGRGCGGGHTSSRPIAK